MSTKTPSSGVQATLAERRAAREKRRERQRETNVSRADAMGTARGAMLPGIDANTNRRTGWHIGCSGWFYWHWKGLFYPADAPTSSWFGHYQREFATVELNAPFYSWPTIATVNSWIRQAASREFIYTVKVCELITHTKRFRGTKTLIKNFGFIADMLGEHMGCLLFQLPPSFHFTPARLKAITEQLESSRRNVVEFRHSSWWNHRVYDAFRECGITFCSVSAPRLPDTLINTSGEVYLRMHGVTQWYRHNYSEIELVKVAASLKSCSASQVWVYFNNDRHGFAVENAKTLLRLGRSLR